ncbi:hypothetical protein [Streptomyces sp. NBC_00091]|uniref:hypothetical protein n=1 Tax=Streptomyces sp. NBC_00091 TaxID=2975648 RepID=UPI0022516F0A|nr:hypothetical protein [Streptomyces sp. NBC_00091]MCX5380387.1 hypothetical protein [Streptomyces sp. NBC_00091]
MVVRNRRTVGLTYRADQWAGKKAGTEALAAVRGWGYASLDPNDLETAVRLLVDAVVKDGGKRISVHLGDQDQKVLVIVLSHLAATASEDALLSQLAALRSVESCGTDASDDGRRVWALLDAAPSPGRPAAA